MAIIVLPASRAFADDAFLDLPVSPALVAYVEAGTGYKLPAGLKIGVVDNNAPMLSTQNVVVKGITVSADAAEKGGKIYLPVYNAVRLQEPNVQALVIHELTHVAQETNGKQYSCDGQREAEAYAMQNKFLNDAGLAPALDSKIIAQFNQCKSL